jgi:2-dehydropantoate 2-reductase
MGRKIAVVGTGAVGAYTGGHLVRTGRDVTFLDPWPEHVEYMKANGIELFGVTEAERFTVPVRALHLSELESLSREAPFDIVFVCTKSYDTAWSATMIAPFLAPDGFVVSLQNCINEETIAGVVGWGRTVGCIASVISVELFAPGHVRRAVPLGGERHTVFRIGEPHGRPTARVAEVADMLRAADSAKVTTNLWGERWSKLCVNSMANAVAGATGLKSAELREVEASRRVSIRIAAEVVTVGTAHGVSIEPITGVRAELYPRALVDGAVMEEIEGVLVSGAREVGIGRPSLAQDLMKGRRIEVDHLNGYVSRMGAEVGIATPANDAIRSLANRVESGELSPSVENLTEVP